MLTVGVVVNPVSGLGGTVGLKGSDGPGTPARAMAMGAQPRAPGRAGETLALLAARFAEAGHIHWLTAGGDMGETILTASGLCAEVVFRPPIRGSVAGDTRRAVAAMVERDVHLVIFAGGDGTAREVLDAAGDTVPAVGIPCGVKIQSACFAISPGAAAALAGEFIQALSGKLPANSELREVMDLDEQALRGGTVSPAMYGYLRVPVARNCLQGGKQRSPAGDNGDAGGIAREVARAMLPGRTYVIGPGTTTHALKRLFSDSLTLLGVDIVANGQVICADAGEADILRAIDQQEAAIVVSYTGGQGFVFGRGNQQISARVIAAVGRQHIHIVASREKLLALSGKPLLADTGCADCDQSLSGYHRVITGYQERLMYPLKAASAIHAAQ